MKIAFMGRSKMLLKTIELLSRVDDLEIAFIWTSNSPDFYTCDSLEFKLMAEQLGCPFYCGADIDLIAGDIEFTSVDLIFSINFVNLIPSYILEQVRFGIINAHAGDLPRYKGNACPNWAILEGEEKIVLTIHEMSSQLDSGRIYTSASFPLNDEIYIGDVYEWFEEIAPKLFFKALRMIQSGNSPIEQPQGRPLRTFPRKPEDAKINWNMDVDQTLRLIRASSRPFSGAWCYVNGNPEQMLYIFRARRVTLDYDFLAVNGQILEKSDNCFTVACGGHAVCVEDFRIGELSQLESHRLVTASMRNRLT